MLVAFTEVGVSLVLASLADVPLRDAAEALGDGIERTRRQCPGVSVRYDGDVVTITGPKAEVYRFWDQAWDAAKAVLVKNAA